MSNHTGARDDGGTTEGRRRDDGGMSGDAANACERLEHQLRQLETRVVSEKRAVEASEEAIREATMELESERERLEANKARVRALKTELATEEEVLRARERQARAGEEAEREAMEALETARKNQADARERRLDAARRAIAEEEAMRRAMLDELAVLRLSDEIREHSARFGGPWVEPDLSDAPKELIDAVVELVRVRRENEAMREALLARAAEKETDE